MVSVGGAIDASWTQIEMDVREGHDIPTEDVERRFAGRWEAVKRVLPYCDEGDFYDNENGFVKVAEYRKGELLPVGESRPAWLLELMKHLED